MKVRNGFVSNSSSSSFIIAFKEDKTPCPTCGRCDASIDVLRKALCSSDDGGWDDKTADEILKNNCEYDEGYINKAAGKKIVELKDKGYSFADISVSYHDNAMQAMIENSKNIIIVEDRN